MIGSVNSTQKFTDTGDMMSKGQELIQQEQKVISRALHLRFHPITVKAAKDCIVIDMDDNSYLDLTAGWAVANIGYGREEIAEAIAEQYRSLSFTTQLSAPSSSFVELAQKLIDLTPGDYYKKVWFGHSGSDANELIAKVIPFATGRTKIISFIGSYHGQTMGASSLSGHQAQAMFEGRGNVVKIPFPNEFRPFSGIKENLTEQVLRYMDEIFSTICPAHDTAAILIEPIQSDGGVIVPPIGFLKALRTVCDEHGIYLIVDEVKVGLGRTGRWFAFEHEDIIPDAIVIGKSLGAGLPISAVVGRAELLDHVMGGHMFTTSGNPVATCAALVNLSIIEQENLAENAHHRGNQFQEGLVKLQAQYKCIGDIRGRGLVIGVEIINPDSAKPNSQLTSAICYRLFELGVLIYSVGIHGNVLEITPPLVISEEEVEKALKAIHQAFEDLEADQFDWNKLSAFQGWG